MLGWSVGLVQRSHKTVLSSPGRWRESIWKVKNAVYGLQPNHNEIIFSLFSVKPCANKATSPCSSLQVYTPEPVPAELQ